MARGLTGRVQRSGRRFERRYSPIVGAPVRYTVWRGDVLLGTVEKGPRGWTVRGRNGAVVLANYGGSRDIAASALERGGANRRRAAPRAIAHSSRGHSHTHGGR